MYTQKTGMHSSRMGTTRSNSRLGGLASSPSTPPPWVWAWTRSPSTSPLGVGLDQIPLNFPLGCGSGPDPPQLPPWLWAWRPSWDQASPGTRHPPRDQAPPGPGTPWDKIPPKPDIPQDQTPPDPPG